MNAIEILEEFSNIEKSSNDGGKPCNGQLSILAKRIANELKINKELSFTAGKNIYIVFNHQNEWHLALPYWSAEVVEYYRDNPPIDITNLVSQINI